MIIRTIVLALFLAGGLAPAAATAAQTEEDRARAYFTDTELVDQSGKTRRFFSDILKGRVVLISLFYTNCTGVCPVVNNTLAGVQDELGDSLGGKIRLLSISIDPDRDDAPTLSRYAANFEPRDGWYFLTGKPEEVKALVRKLGHMENGPEAHTGVLALGNVEEAVWTKMPPNAPPNILAAKLLLLAEGGHGK